MNSRGQITIVVILGVGFIAALLGWLAFGQSSKQATKYFGTPQLVEISQAPEVWLADLTPGDSFDRASDVEHEFARKPQGWSTTHVLTIDGQPLQVSKWKDVSQAKGMQHLRHALTLDASYDWDQPSEFTETVQWGQLLLFTGGESSVILLLAVDYRAVKLIDKRRQLRCEPLRAGFDRVLPDFSP